MLVIFSGLGILALILSIKFDSKILLIPVGLCLLAPVVTTFHYPVWQTMLQVGLISLCIISQSMSACLKNKRLKAETSSFDF